MTNALNPLTPNPQSPIPAPSPASSPSWRDAIAANPWAACLLPLVTFMIVGSLEPTHEKLGGAAIGLAIPYAFYPAVYALKIVLTIAVFVLVWPGYKRFPLRVGPLAAVIGIVGAAVWIGLCTLQTSYLAPYLTWLGDFGARSAYDPLSAIESRWAAWGFLALRFVGLAAVVPLAEEIFYRGLVMPFLVRQEWWTVPQGETNLAGILLSVVLPLLSHPGEPLAAIAWFSMVTWLFLRTRNVWDCVAAHAITNLILGIYVVTTGAWWLW